MDNNNNLPDFDPYTEPAVTPPQVQPTQEVQPQVQPPQNLQYGASQPYAYGAQPYKYYPTGLAVASLIFGILSVIACLFLPYVFFLPILGIILGAVYKSKHYPVGRGMSTAGIVLSIVSIVLCAIFYVIIILNIGTIMEYYRDMAPEYYDQFLAPYEEILREAGIME
jgi:hypothetical protein